MLTRRCLIALLAVMIAMGPPDRGVAQTADKSSYILFIHAGTPPNVPDASTRLTEIIKKLVQAGYSVRKPDGSRNGDGPAVDYFDDSDLATAQDVAAIINGVTPSPQSPIAPRRQRGNPHYLTIWLF
jgi:hypothetical protein